MPEHLIPQTPPNANGPNSVQVAPKSYALNKSDIWEHLYGTSRQALFTWRGFLSAGPEIAWWMLRGIAANLHHLRVRQLHGQVRSYADLPAGVPDTGVVFLEGIPFQIGLR